MPSREARPARPFPAQLRLVLLGGAAADAALLQRCRQLQVPLAVSWGMSEAASQVATTAPGDWQGDGDCGPPLALARVAARSGVLEVAGPQLAAGHLRSSDRGSVDAGGRVRVVGRTDGVIISGGENIAPQEVEAVLLLHPAVAAVGVAGTPDRRWGARPVAYVVARQSAAAALPSLAALQAFCGTRLARYKVPIAFIWVADLPRSGLGKLQRFRLGQEAPWLLPPAATNTLTRGGAASSVEG